jgi:DNA-binding NarL/FixJ family response regulator
MHTTQTMHMTQSLDCRRPGRTRVFLVDEHELVRRGVRSLLEEDCCLDVVGEAATAAEARVRIPAVHPDVTVLDLRLPDGDGLQLCRELRAEHPQLACLLLTSAPAEDALHDAVLAGAAGCLPKQVRGAELLDAVHTAARGEPVLGRVTLRLLERLRERARVEDPLALLTQQERRILVLIGDGRTNREIAQELHLSIKTVKNYVTSMLAKLGLSRRTQAAVHVTRLADARTPRR